MSRLKHVCAMLSLMITLSLAATSVAGISYTVRKGDTLQKISKKSNVSVREIKESNRLKCAKLSIGMKLILPDSEKNHIKREAVYYGKKGSSRHLVSHKLKSKSHLPDTYTVRNGDTICKIAKLFRISNNELKGINGLKGNTLKTGQKLYVAKVNSDLKEDASARGPDTEKTGPPVTLTRLEEVKELSASEDVLLELSIKERLILFAKKMLHLPYRFGGNGSFGLDCSAYVQKVYGFIGHDIPRSAREQFNLGEAVDKDDLVTGDLVFFKTYASFPSHVGIYLGNSLFIHASSLAKKVTIDSLETPYYFRHFIGAKRIIPEDDFDMGSGEASISAN